MTLKAAETSPNGWVQIHPLVVRVWHWLNAVAIVVMVMSGWRIYNASPVFPFRFPNEITLGGWLAGALQWHFAAMWLLVVNLIVYLLYGLGSGHFYRSFLPVGPRSVLKVVGLALRGRLTHEIGIYNAVQRAAYIGVLGAIVTTVLSGLAIWKPVQLQEITAFMGGYDDARIVHFFGMVAILDFLIVHVVLVVIVPGTLKPMITGFARHKGEGKR